MRKYRRLVVVVLCLTLKRKRVCDNAEMIVCQQSSVHDCPYPLQLALDGQSRLYVSNTSAVDVFDADDRYLTIIDSNVYGGGSRDIAINQATNEIYILGIKDKVYRLALNAAK